MIVHHRSSIRGYTYKDKLTCSNHTFRAERSLCVKAAEVDLLHLHVSGCVFHMIAYLPIGTSRPQEN